MDRKTFTIPPGYEAVRDSEGRATGDVRQVPDAGSSAESCDDLRAKAEIAIQKILIDLWNDTGEDLSQVEVDTRNFSNYNVEIFFESEIER